MSFRSQSGTFFFKILSTSPINVNLVISFKFSSCRVTSSFSTRANLTYWVTQCFGQSVLEVGGCLRYLAFNLLLSIKDSYLNFFMAGGPLVHCIVVEWSPIDHNVTSSQYYSGQLTSFNIIGWTVSQCTPNLL